MTISHKPMRLLTVAIICLWANAHGDDAYILVSDDEYFNSVEAVADVVEDGIFERPVDPLAPRITVHSPGEGSKYRAPIDIDLQFVPNEGATIDLKTLRITYGLLGINVTKRVTEHAKVTPNGILSKGAKLPTGKHKLTIAIADNQGRIGKRKLKFQIIK